MSRNRCPHFRAAVTCVMEVGMDEGDSGLAVTITDTDGGMDRGERQ